MPGKASVMLRSGFKMEPRHRVVTHVIAYATIVKFGYTNLTANT